MNDYSDDSRTQTHSRAEAERDRKKHVYSQCYKQKKPFVQTNTFFSQRKSGLLFCSWEQSTLFTHTKKFVVFNTNISIASASKIRFSNCPTKQHNHKKSRNYFVFINNPNLTHVWDIEIWVNENSSRNRQRRWVWSVWNQKLVECIWGKKQMPFL